MEMPVVVGIALVAFLLLLRHFAIRRVAARQGRFVWLMFVPTLFGSVVILWASIQVFASAPLFGTLMAIGGVIYLAVLVRFLTLLSRSVTSTGPQDDITTAITEPLADYVSTMTGLLLIGGIVALVGLIIWGVSQAAR
jgi:hypothetical protein